ncbi:MAG: hypothetical protein QOE64_2065 [Frankiales bacterium]|nr:hypothetical protein [Frankiales bacterium]
MRRRGLLVALVAALCFPVPAQAHETDPRVVTVLDDIRPALPAGVVVQIRSSLAEELVAENPTPTPLVVLGDEDRPFLRISHSGVEADLNSADWYLTNSPTGTGPLPPTAVRGAPARWVTVSTGDSWGWFDHRLHPQRLTAPGSVRKRTQVGEWQVPFEYGGHRSLVVGHLELVPLLGAFSNTVDPAPPGLTVSVLPGRLPGLFLVDVAGADVVVFGTDGKPFLRLGKHLVEVDEGSPSWAEDQRARGNVVTTAARRPQWHRLATTPTITWLEPRLRYPRDLPRDPSKAADLQRWSVPLTVNGRRGELAGLIRWTPAPGVTSGGAGSDKARVFTVIGILLLGVALATGLSLWRRLRR